MNCQDFHIAIGDLVDGRTNGDTAEPAARLQEHLATCAHCAALAADLRAIRAAARALPPQQPAPHVWTAIAAAVAAEASESEAGVPEPVMAGARRRPSTGVAWQRAWQPLAAAAMAVIVTATLATVGTRLEPLKESPGGGAATTVADAATAVDVVRHAEGEYIQAISGLEAITSTGGDELDPETAGVLKANLTVIDRAIGESRAALKTEPDSQLAISSLFEALRSKVALLQDMVALINEMRQGNAEGAARIASGLNQ